MQPSPSPRKEISGGPSNGWTSLSYSAEILGRKTFSIRPYCTQAAAHIVAFVHLYDISFGLRACAELRDALHDIHPLPLPNTNQLVQQEIVGDLDQQRKTHACGYPTRAGQDCLTPRRKKHTSCLLGSRSRSPCLPVPYVINHHSHVNHQLFPPVP